MADIDSADSGDDRLIRRQLDGLLSDEEFTAFNDRLATDVAFRHRFLQLVDLDSALHEIFGAAPTSSTPLPEPRRLWPWIALTVASVCAAVLMMSVLNFLRDIRSDNDLQRSVADLEVEPQDTIDTQQLTEVASSVPNVPAAVVVGVSSEYDGGLRVGQRLKAELVKFSAGQLQLEFLSGARVAMAGPAELQIESQLQATLKAGRVSTYVPARARGFVLNGPGAAIVDLGTEFRMSVDADGMTDVAVTDGEIELSLLGEDGNTLFSKRLQESGAVRFGNRTGSIEDGSFDTDIGYPSIQLPAIQPLKVSDAYAADVRSLEPSIYWRFEDGQPNLLADDTQPPVNAIIHHEADTDCITLQNGYVQFRRDESALRYLRTETSIPDLASGPVTFEFWMWPDDLQHSTCLGVYPDDDAPGRNHLNVIEVVSDTFLIHEPGAVRFLVRSPPERDAKFGINAFTPGLCTPGQWQHVAAVWDVSEIRLYFNGQLMRRVSTDQTFGEGRFHVIVGQLKPYVVERQFSGAIDELAVYRRALTDQDVQRHFHRIAADNPHCTAQPAAAGDQ